MDEQTELLIEQRLSVFSDEPDLNDWFEVMCGAAMAVLGIVPPCDTRRTCRS